MLNECVVSMFVSIIACCCFNLFKVNYFSNRCGVRMLGNDMMPDNLMGIKIIYIKFTMNGYLKTDNAAKSRTHNEWPCVYQFN